MIRRVGEAVGEAVLKTAGRSLARVQERRPLPVDLLESDEAYLAVFDAPGVAAGDVQVTYDDGAIEVRMDRFRSFYEGFEMRVPGRSVALDGRVRLPSDASIVPDEATATLQPEGTLHVRIPKRDGGGKGGDGPTPAIRRRAGSGDTTDAEPADAS